MSNFIEEFLQKIPADVREEWKKWILTVPAEHRAQAMNARYTAVYGGSVQQVREQARQQAAKQHQMTNTARDIVHIDDMRKKEEKTKQILIIAGTATIALLIGKSMSKNSRRKK